MTLDCRQKESIRKLVREFASKLGFNEYIPVDFTVTGKTAGVFRPSGKSIGFNEVLAGANYEDFIARTVPHEVAHYIDFRQNGDKQRKFKDGRRDMHGKYFKAIMRQLGIKNPTTYHDYDTSHIKTRKQRRWAYACPCREWPISTVMHNRIQKGEVRVCPDCKNEITKENFLGHEVKP